jgi:dephospho-CoA kinase
MEPGTDCYGTILEAFKDEDILQENGQFHRGKLATVIFSSEEKREALNAIVHPAVKDYVRQVYEAEGQKQELELLILEAALLIEEDYGAICDELWYIYTSEENRRMRLKESRGYSDEKIDGIFASQLSEAQFRAGTQVTIDNNGSLEETYQQIEQALRREANE